MLGICLNYITNVHWLFRYNKLSVLKRKYIVFPTEQKIIRPIQKGAMPKKTFGYAKLNFFLNFFLFKQTLSMLYLTH